MAEVIGLVASVVQLAGTGLKLSQALYQYADGVANSDRRIKEVAKEIKLTSIVIEELGKVFKQDNTLSLISDSAVATANETLKECSAVFGEIETTLDKSRKGKMGRLMLPFRENKIELLRSHIDKLKSTLQLLMQVLLHAHQVASSKIDREAEARQRDEIRKLLEEKRNNTKRYEESLRTFAASDSSTVVEDDTLSLDDDESASMVEIKAIGSTMNPDSLAECMQHVRTLLESMERLQKALVNKPEGDGHSDHQQAAIESYFVARSHLDSILLGSSNKANPKDSAMPIQQLDSVKNLSLNSNRVEATNAMMVLAPRTTSADKKKNKKWMNTIYSKRSTKPRAKSEANVVPCPTKDGAGSPPVVPGTASGRFGGSETLDMRISYSRTSDPQRTYRPPINSESSSGYSKSPPSYTNADTRLPEPWIPSACRLELAPSAYVPHLKQQKEEGVPIPNHMGLSEGYIPFDPSAHTPYGPRPIARSERRENTHGGKANGIEAAPEGNDEVDELLREWTTCFA